MFRGRGRSRDTLLLLGGLLLFVGLSHLFQVGVNVGYYSGGGASTYQAPVQQLPSPTSLTTKLSTIASKSDLDSGGLPSPPKSTLPVTSHHDPMTGAGEVSSTSVYHITVQTKGSPGWCRMLLSAAMSGIEIHNIGWKHSYAHNKRPGWVLQWISQKGLKDDDIVIFNDGGDTVFSGVPTTEMVRQFLRIERGESESSSGGGPSLIFNAEANCYHQQAFGGSAWGVKKGRCLTAYKRYNPTVRSKFRYLNGGAWIGRVRAIRQVLGEVKAIFDRDSSLWCDQSMYGKLLLSGKYSNILGLDYNTSIFLPTYHLRAQTDFCAVYLPPSKEANVVSAPALPQQLRMCGTGSIPGIIHFNGKSEGQFTLDVLRRTNWYNKAKAEANKTRLLEGMGTYLGTGGERVPLRSVCSSWGI